MVLRWLLLLVVAFYAVCSLCLVALRWIDPPFTSVHVERRIQALIQRRAYRKRYTFVPLSRISVAFRHAVVAGEDARFYQHQGIDWKELGKVLDDDLEHGRLGRGGSTITQQLVKNLFLTTSRSIVRKGVEFTLVPFAELILSKKRMLELYMNVVEWGPGIYGAEAAARNYYHIPASAIGREQGARLAACLPAPLKRKPARMDEYSATILGRMAQVGW
ncbi:MAG: monofunctional biosynthetic peptidoglycan transglycosylase [Acidobacteria bacterium]|nr:monofunctional biosynthetic peptidoglycan transglycosylase [Acidobacteriota bacterium]